MDFGDYFPAIVINSLENHIFGYANSVNTHNIDYIRLSIGYISLMIVIPMSIVAIKSIFNIQFLFAGITKTPYYFSCFSA